MKAQQRTRNSYACGAYPQSRSDSWPVRDGNSREGEGGCRMSAWKGVLIGSDKAAPVGAAFGTGSPADVF
jgi:hypothetical protein